jgi:hypothetical protein
MENKTFMVSQLDNVSCPQGNMERWNGKQNLYGLTAGQCELPAREYGEEKNNNDGMETKTYMVSQLVNVSSTRKGMRKRNINVTCHQPARGANGIRWNGWRLFV